MKIGFQFKRRSGVTPDYGCTQEKEIKSKAGFKTDP